MSETITIEINGEHSNAIKSAFMAWFLDGGGEEDFAESLEYAGLSVTTNHDCKSGDCQKITVTQL